MKEGEVMTSTQVHQIINVKAMMIHERVKTMTMRREIWWEWTLSFTPTMQPCVVNKND